jgi:deazaflavin-dependent oxidoreductase (nitroreductase family)
MSRAGYFYLRHIAPRFDKRVIPLTNGHFSSAGINKVGLLTTVGARSGKPRTQPLTMIPEDAGVLVVGSNYGHAPHPSWAHNLVAHPECTVRFRGPERRYRAELLSGESRDAAWATAVDFYMGYESYRRTCAPREIRLFRLHPAN